MVLLLMMIVSSVSSQVKYIIDGDTVVYYTLKENRKIAILLLDRDKYKNLDITNSELINEQTIKLKKYEEYYELLVEKNDKLSLINDTIILTNKKLEKNVEKYKARNNIKSGAIFLSSIINIILILILIK